MSDNEYKIVGLYDHNADSYNMVKAAYESGEDVVGIVHATGTGKSYNALQLAYDNRGKKIVYVVPSNGIIEHIKKIIEDNPNLNIERDFPNLEFRTYSSLLEPYKKEKIGEVECDLLILDEFHHIGAPIWGKAVNKLIETHPGAKIFGMTAYTVRDRGTSYERDMANPDTDELFSGKIESRYDLCDAMIDGVLPKPVYKSAYTNLIGLESKLEERVQKLNATSREYHEYMAILSDVKRRIHEAPSISNILRKNIKPNGKYIYFCPPCSEEGTNDIETIKHQAIEWFKQFVPEEDIIIYTSTSDMGEDGKLNRDAFYDDVTLDGEKVDNKLRVMFAINQYNEGIHAPNIDGVIMGRGTTSDIVYFEQLGRALAVRGNTKEKFDKLEKYSIEELLEMCKSRDIPVTENATKEDLVEKLIAPVVIDLTNNYEFIKELENNLRDRIKDIQTNGLGSHRDVKIRDASFDIEIENQDLLEMLRYVSDRLTMTWEDYYELAKAYYEHCGDLLIPHRFKTNNGYIHEENGLVNLGHWINHQRAQYSNLSQERQQLLKSIGFVLDAIEEQWKKMYELAKIYYNHYGNLLIPNSFKTTNGYDFDENGVRLGAWVRSQREAYQGKGTTVLNESRIDLLKKIGMVFENIRTDQWMQYYNLAKIYYDHHGNLDIQFNFRTTNGYDFDKNGIALGEWITRQRQSYKGSNNSSLTDDRRNLLESIGMIFDVHAKQWIDSYNLAKIYYEHHGNLRIPSSFKTINGYEFSETGITLGAWIYSQRKHYEKKELGKITSNQIHLLEQIGMIWNINKNKEGINNICGQYNIDKDKNKIILSHISIQELQSKIEFLKAQNIPIVDKNGLLIDIFSMSSPDMKEKYGISLEEIISEYYIKNQMGKGV
ncbi:MAG: Helicase associated domain protein [Bacilli bacterium]|nr:Helicase associated domain protein [Bacilli bacterium]